MNKNKQKEQISFFGYFIIIIICTLFAIYNWIKMVYDPNDPYVLKWEGIILDENTTYHFTEYDDTIVAKQKFSRGKGKDILLHYNSDEMGGIVPPYWAGLNFEKNKWKLHLIDVNTNPNDIDNILFFKRSDINRGVVDAFFNLKHKYGEFIWDKISEERVKRKGGYVKDSIEGEELFEKHFFNTPLGTINSRYYFQLKKRLGKTILPWDDEGVKRVRYKIKKEGDTISFRYNTEEPNTIDRLNFVFTNTSSVRGGVYQLIYNPKGKHKWVLKDKVRRTEQEIDNNAEYFQVADMMFSKAAKYTWYQKGLLFFNIVLSILCALLIFLLRKGGYNSFLSRVEKLAILLLCFCLLGFPILARAIELQDFGLTRQIIYCLIPLIINLSFYYLIHPLIRKIVLCTIGLLVLLFVLYIVLDYVQIIKWVPLGLFIVLVISLLYAYLKERTGFLGLVNWVFDKIKEGPIFVPITMIIFLIIVMGYGTRGERVFGLFPVLHFVKIVLLLGFVLVYRFTKSDKTFMEWFALFVIAISSTMATSDGGSLVMTIIAWLIYKSVKNEFPIIFFSHEKLTDIRSFFVRRIGFRLTRLCICVFDSLVGVYKSIFKVTRMCLLCILPRPIVKFFKESTDTTSRSFFVLGYIFIAIISIFYLNSFGDKTYRLNYSFFNPQDEVYNSVSLSHRQTIAAIYHNLRILFFEGKWLKGVEHLQIPSHMKSVSHTDYAIHWSVMENGTLFLIPMLIVLWFFIKNTVVCMQFLVFKDIESNRLLVQNKETLRNFIPFLMAFLLVQTLLPIVSNLMLFGPFTGIPFPGVSISIGDTLFLSLLFFLLTNLRNRENTSITISKKQLLFKHGNAYAWIVLIAIVFLIGVRVWVSHSNGEETKIVSSLDICDEIDNFEDAQSKLNGNMYQISGDGNKLEKLQKLGKSKALSKECIKKIYLYKNNQNLSADKMNELLKDKLNNSEVFHLNTKKQLRIVELSYRKDEIGKIDGVSVYKQRCYVNGSPRKTNSRFYEHINFESEKKENVDYQMVAKLYGEIENHAKELENFIEKELNEFKNLSKQEQFLKFKKNLQISLLISKNSANDEENEQENNGKNKIHKFDYDIAISYPFEKDAKFSDFFPGSTKKILMAHFFVESGVVNESSTNKTDFVKWIKTSNSDTVPGYYANHIKGKREREFEDFLQEKYEMTKDNYFDTEKNNKKAFNELEEKYQKNILIGGKIKYSADLIHRWFRANAFDAFYNKDSLKQKDLYDILNSPLQDEGTAKKIAPKLDNYKRFICKTGTLEEDIDFNNDNDKKENIASAFGIASKEYTITVLINGYQPSKGEKDLTAISLFQKIIPIIEMKYLKVSTEKQNKN